jgi:hypothetical protein
MLTSTNLFRFGASPLTDMVAAEQKASAPKCRLTSPFFIKAIRENDVNNQFVFDLLCRYFSQNDSIIWSDALLEHGLVETPNANAEDGIL